MSSGLLESFLASNRPSHSAERMSSSSEGTTKWRRYTGEYELPVDRTLLVAVVAGCEL